MKERQFTPFFVSFEEAINDLDDKDMQLSLYRAIVRYGLYGEVPELSGIAGTLWRLILPALQSNRKQFINGSSGGAPKGNQNARKTTQKQPNDNPKTSLKDKDKRLSDESKESADKPRKRRRLSPASPTPDEFEEIVRFYNDTCKSLRPVKILTDKRRAAVSARLREHGREAVFDVIRAAGRSSFLAGQNTREWTADFDWIFRPVNFVKVLEGKYENKEKSQQYGTESNRQINERLVVGRNFEVF